MNITRSASLISILILTLVTNPGYAEEPSSYIENFSCTDKPFGLNLPTKLSKLMKLGKIQRIEKKKTEQWETYSVTYKDIYFSGFTLGIITFSNNVDQYMISYAEITSKKWIDIAPFLIGNPISLVRKRLSSFADNDPSLQAKYGNEAGDLSFEISDDKIKKIKYWCYTG